MIITLIKILQDKYKKSRIWQSKKILMMGGQVSWKKKRKNHIYSPQSGRVAIY